jgi:hypothetical protein
MHFLQEDCQQPAQTHFPLAARRFRVLRDFDERGNKISCFSATKSLVERLKE